MRLKATLKEHVICLTSTKNIEDEVLILKAADMVNSTKEKMFHELREDLMRKVMNMTIDDIKFEEVGHFGLNIRVTPNHPSKERRNTMGLVFWGEA